ncbi:serine carboxypeptidase-like 9 isoform X1 [Triticum urartu]|uniref:Serine carboxypeptidase-like 18 n=2 Tax=Triticum TaxID=4564 RepID=A0A8R7UK57_TRIUA|nr:serine carboxypeptidase-like 9 isoform X1 [Triticum urartu]
MGKASLPFPSLVVPLVLLLLPLSRSASVVTHLPGFHGRLPFHLETGYVGVDEETGAELFYYFVESERSPETDPLILWMTGGPFCSGMIFFEVGPMKFVLAPYNGSLPQLTYNPYSWSKTASIILLDSPVGTGFSYARDVKGYHDIGDFSFSMHVVIFLNKWFTDHPHYQSNPFFVGGSSYAGKMSPIIAQHISQEIELGKQPRINLKGYVVGNPVTGSDYDDNFRVPYAHGVGIISDQLYEAAILNCKGSYIRPTNKMCVRVLNTFQNLVSEIDVPQILGVNCIRGMLTHKFLSEEYTQLSDPSPEQPTIDCFSYRYYLCNIWANDDSTREALGVKRGTTREFIRCKKSIPYASEVPSSIKYHFNLTSRGYRALVFSGDHDLVIPFLSTHAWIRSFNFSVVDDWRAWHLDGQAAGFTITYANYMTFATIKGGGHVSIEHRPKQCLAMVQRWLDNEPL